MAIACPAPSPPLPPLMPAIHRSLLCALLLGAAALASAAPRPVKVMIVSMVDQEAGLWSDALQLRQAIAVPGLSPRFPLVRCNADDVCQMVTDMGKANAAASVAAVVHSGLFDLRAAYFLVAGTGGIDPAAGSTGSAAWARYLVDGDLAWELDARERPAGWSTGYLGINMRTPTDAPPLHYGTEMYRLNEGLLNQALALSRGVTLADAPAAQGFRARYGAAPANQPPQVRQCDALTGNTRFHGALLGQRARDWVRLLTAGQGTYCITAQEDNATYTALRRGAQAGLLDDQRVAVLRTASDFDRPPPGMTPLESLTEDSGGYPIALRNLYLAGAPLVREIVANWPRWQAGPPPDSATTAATPASAAGAAAAISATTSAASTATDIAMPDHRTQAPAVPSAAAPYAPRIMIVNMFGAEAAPFVKGLRLGEKHLVPGVSARYPDMLCNRERVCQLTTDMGYANAAASMTALL
ncbi:purine nucleoside permease [Duganella callida]|uniref:Purine nucleoside permease n=1 Tax=Duganella callida TaxID=2561932 RepID=A0A4Y9SX12_9BURK|nr:purine nucleoside permease [Duganella callida]